MAKIILKNSGVASEVPTSLSAGELGINYEDELLHWLDSSAVIRETTLNPAPLASPAFTGIPTAPTAAGATNTTQIATTAYVQGELSAKQAADADLTSWAAITRASGFDTFAATPSSANLAAVLTDETGSGAAVFATSPTLVTPALGTPSALVLTNATALPASALVATTSTAVGFGSIELGHASDTTLARSAAGIVTVEGTALKKAGRETIWIPAGAMRTRTTNGAALGTLEMATNKNMFFTYDFDTTTQEFLQFEIHFPKSWDLGTVTFQPVWSHPATTTNFGVVWQLAAVARSDDDAGDVAFGTAQTSTDTGGTTNDIYIGPECSAITIAGTPAAGDTVQFQLARAPANGSDTMAVDARLHGIRLFFTTNAATDV